MGLRDLQLPVNSFFLLFFQKILGLQSGCKSFFQFSVDGSKFIITQVLKTNGWILKDIWAN